MPLARLVQLLALSCLGSFGLLLAGDALLEWGPQPNPQTPRWQLEGWRQLAADPEKRREASLLLAAQANADPRRQLQLLGNQAWGPDPIAGVVLKQQALAQTALGEHQAAELLWQQLQRRFPKDPSSADALYSLGASRPSLRQQLLKRFPAHPAALAAALEAGPSPKDQRQGALHLARWGIRWPGADRKLQAVCRRERALKPAERNQLATGLAQLSDTDRAQACLRGTAASPTTTLALAKALLKGPGGGQGQAQLQQADQLLLSLAQGHPQSLEAAEATRLLAEGEGASNLQALGQLPENLRQSAPVQARLALENGKVESALAVLNRWPKDPASWELQWQAARLALLKGQWSTARQLLSSPTNQYLPLDLSARQKFWLGFSLLRLGQERAARAQWELVQKQHPEGYYGWRTAVRLGRGDQQLKSAGTSALAKPSWSPLASPSPSLNRLWRLGLNQEAWEHWRHQRGGQAPQRAQELLLEGRLRQGAGDDWIGLGQLEQAGLKLQPHQCNARSQLLNAQRRPRFVEIFNPVAERHGLAASLLAGVAKQESRFSPGVKSVAGAVGLMQLMPETAQELAGRPLGNEELENPQISADLGGLYIKQLLGLWAGNPILAIASYNAGPGAVSRWASRPIGPWPELWVEAIPYPETRLYVKKVLGNAWTYQQERLANC
ncbi:transglycosylase SLT domain-containing protein [Cyanobium sp. HWJ4-Hawea]|uniref:lytic transglycosylase domain-containing protein n=1 Tax=Cyanobium sp. HWJ4-Hawea TaxID=2823713 RepID=UPI0039656118